MNTAKFSGASGRRSLAMVLRTVQFAAIVGAMVSSTLALADGFWESSRDQSALMAPLADSSAGGACLPLIIPANFTNPVSQSGYWLYFLAQGQLVGGPQRDTFFFELLSNQTGAIDLATGSNVNYDTCNQCTSLYRDENDVYGTPAKIFFQDRGIVTVALQPGFPVSPIPVAFDNLRLIEVTINPDTGHSTPVPGGECYVGVRDRVFASGFDS